MKYRDRVLRQDHSGPNAGPLAALLSKRCADLRRSAKSVTIRTPSKEYKGLNYRQGNAGAPQESGGLLFVILSEAKNLGLRRTTHRDSSLAALAQNDLVLGARPLFFGAPFGSCFAREPRLPEPISPRSLEPPRQARPAPALLHVISLRGWPVSTRGRGPPEASTHASAKRLSQITPAGAARERRGHLDALSRRLTPPLHTGGVTESEFSPTRSGRILCAELAKTVPLCWSESRLPL